MEEEVDKLKKFGKVVFKTMKTVMKPILIPILIIVILVIVFATILHYLIGEDTALKEEEWSNVPYAAEQFISNVTVEEDGTIKTDYTAQEIWDKLDQNKSRVIYFLDGPKQLAKLMTAEISAMYLDTRPNPDEKIDWENSPIITGDAESDETYGIIKMKRANKDDEDNPTTMTYVSPTKFQELIDAGDWDAIKNHFTIKKSGQDVNLGGTNLSGAFSNFSSLDGVLFIGDSFVTKLQSSNLISGATFKGSESATPEYWLADENFNTLPENDDSVKSVCVMLGINGLNQTSQMEQLIKKLTEKYDGKTIYVQQVFPVASKYKNASTVNKNVKTYNEAVQKLCTGDVKFIDTTTGYVDSDGKAIDEMYDEDNLNLKDFEQLAKNLQSKLPNNTQTAGTTTGTTDTTGDVNTPDTSNNSDGAITSQDSPFTKYNFTGMNDTRFLGICAVCQNEQDMAGPIGIAAEASLMANQIDLMHSSTYPPTADGLYKWVGGGWFGGAQKCLRTLKSHDGTMEVKEEYKKIVWAVLVEGKRTLPVYVNQHYTGSRLVRISPSGDKNNPDDYIKDVTVCYEPKTHWTYYCHPAKGADPFGYSDTAKSDAVKYNLPTGCYSIDELGIGNWITDSGYVGGAASPYYAYVATWSQTPESGIVISESPPIDFQSMVRNYKMPFCYLWEMLVLSRSQEFTFDLAKLVLDSQLEITVHDNLTTYKTVKTTQTTYYERDVAEDGTTSNETSSDGRPTSSESISKYNTLDIALTKAKVWFLEYTKKYHYQEGQYDQIGEPESTTEYGSWQKSSDGTKEYSEDTTTTTTEYVKEDKWIAEPEIIKERTDPKEKDENGKDVDNFVKIFLRHGQANSNIRSGINWLIEILENNKYTSDYVDLTKYLIYKAVGMDLGVTTIDLEKLKPGAFDSVYSGLGGGVSAEWHNNYTREQFIAMVQNYKPAYGYNPDTKMTNQQGYDKWFKPYAGDFFYIATSYNLDPMYIFAKGINESGWGKSNIAQKKGNVFGYGAVDDNPMGGAWEFSSPTDAIRQVCKDLRNTFLNPDNWKYKKAVEKGQTPGTIEGIEVVYASAGLESAEAIEKIMGKVFGEQYMTRVGGTGGGNGNILESCERVMQMLLPRKLKYNHQRIGHNIERSYNEENGGIVCATYVALVLYDAGVVNPNVLNKYNYHYCPSLQDALEAMGNWEEIPKAQRQPGDVYLRINGPAMSNHAAIYVKGTSVWDQRSSCSGSWGAATKSLHTYGSLSTMTASNVHYYRPKGQ